MKNNFKLDIVIGSMLFALFLGAGNLIFPPLLGQQAGDKFLIAISGFLVTGVGLPVLAIIVISSVEGDLKKLSDRVHPVFSFLFPMISYLSIGPCYAIPRTGVVSFEVGINPFLSEIGQTEWYMLCIYTLLFFGVTLYLSLHPSKMIDLFGKILTPLLVIMVVIIVVKSIISPIGPLNVSNSLYENHAFAEGIIQGYLTMDAIGAFVFGIVIVQAIRAKDVTEPTHIKKITMVSGIIAAVGLIFIYLSLAYIGATSAKLGISNTGALILTNVVKHLFGTSGQILLGFIITLACLTTSIGLTSACATFFSKQFTSISYKSAVKIICLFSFMISNLGLEQLLNVSLPILMIIYPITITLIILSCFHAWIGNRNMVYICSIIGTLMISLLSNLDRVNFIDLSHILELIPLYKEGLGWLIPSCIGGVIGLFIHKTQM
ncbi:branched-chain amino acid transport system II carrier protein [Bacillus sp. SRB3LM]|uniref:branched-chain amino acid transport system II carrier protein n=1 Tax=Bacillus sp. SRB3LM TaxID=2608689 RepID=UPI0018C38E4E|nr:branched-chain amino acid transport system II carrier protein [Bacillus sp. SRB3LM]MBG0969482.1 branched-chain amino acid transport system II carrier protein [Bacillus sp. SRB3LM]MBG0971971.1 branched-chain amino acid transport system II carrier protein [Bacillus sp. SRB3LM]MBG0971993.1 branched-chain amino acid transport system II carrier protein [Bacillus sp. SRB3LM]